MYINQYTLYMLHSNIHIYIYVYMYICICIWGMIWNKKQLTNMFKRG